MSRAVVFALFSCVAGCGGGAPNGGGNPMAPPPSTGLTIENAIGTYSGLARKVCSTFNDPLYPPFTDFAVDELTFTFQNPSGRDLVGAEVYRDAAPTSLGTVGLCQPDVCNLPLEAAGLTQMTACIVEGGATTTTGRIRVYTRQRFQPSDLYRLRLGLTSRATQSNVAEVPVVRVAGASNDRPVFLGLAGSDSPSGPRHIAVVKFDFYVPPKAAGGSSYGVEVELSYRDRAGRLFAINRWTVGPSGVPVYQSLPDTQESVAPPPWRVSVKFRTTLDPILVNSPESCSEDFPGPGRPKCSAGGLPPSRNAAVSEETRELEIAQ
jgi:hypothetical protein